MNPAIRTLITADDSPAIFVGPSSHWATPSIALPVARIVELVHEIRMANADAIIRGFVAGPVAVRERSLAEWFRRMNPS